MADSKTFGEQRDVDSARLVRATLAATPQDVSAAASDGLAMSLVPYPPTRTLDYIQRAFFYDVRAALQAAWMLGWQARHAQPVSD